jgi:hypothetical protein
MPMTLQLSMPHVCLLIVVLVLFVLRRSHLSVLDLETLSATSAGLMSTSHGCLHMCGYVIVVAVRGSIPAASHTTREPVDAGFDDKMLGGLARV